MMACNPRPCFPISDASNSASMDAIFHSSIKVADCFTMENLHNFNSGKLRCAAGFAMNGSSMHEGIGLIVFFRSPAKIAKVVVEWVAISMAAFMVRRRAWSTESFQHEKMYRSHMAYHGCGHVDRWVSPESRLSPDALFYPSTAIPFAGNKSSDIFYSTVITYFVKIFKADNGAPLLNHIQSPITDGPQRSMWHQYGRLLFGSYPSHIGELYA